MFIDQLNMSEVTISSLEDINKRVSWYFNIRNAPHLLFTFCLLLKQFFPSSYIATVLEEKETLSILTRI